MSGVDLTRAIAYRGFALNTVSGDPAVGCAIETADISDVEVRQFIEPLALQDGFTMGPVYLGVRKVVLTGAVYDLSLGDACTRLASLEAALSPTAEYVATPATRGFANLTFYEPVTGTPLRTLSVRSNGLRVLWTRALFASSQWLPHAIPWSASFLAISPDIT